MTVLLTLVALGYALIFFLMWAILHLAKKTDALSDALMADLIREQEREKQ